MQSNHAKWLSYQFDKQLKFNNYISPMVLDESLILSALASFFYAVLIQNCSFSFHSQGQREMPWINQSLERLAQPQPRPNHRSPTRRRDLDSAKPNPGLTTTPGEMGRYFQVSQNVSKMSLQKAHTSLKTKKLAKVSKISLCLGWGQIMQPNHPQNNKAKESTWIRTKTSYLKKKKTLKSDPSIWGPCKCRLFLLINLHSVKDEWMNAYRKNEWKHDRFADSI